MLIPEYLNFVSSIIVFSWISILELENFLVVLHLFFFGNHLGHRRVMQRRLIIFKLLFLPFCNRDVEVLLERFHPPPTAFYFVIGLL